MAKLTELGAPFGVERRVNAGGRAPGEERRAMQRAAEQLALQQGGANWREMAAVAKVGFAIAKVTARNMVRAGELRPVDEVRTPHNNRPMVRYVPASSAGGWATAATGFGPINSVMRSWR